MSLVNMIHGALINIKANKIRVFLTMIGIIIGISSVVVILAIGDGVKAEFARTTSDIEANKIEVNFYQTYYSEGVLTIEPFTSENMTNLPKLKGVEKVEMNADNYYSYNDVYSVYGNVSLLGKNATVFAVAYEDYGVYPVITGRYFEESDTLNDVIVLDYQTALSLFDTVEEAIGISLNIESKMYEIIGVLEKSESIFDMTDSFVQQASLDRIKGEKLPELEEVVPPTSIYVYVEPGSDYDEIIDNVIAELESENMGIHGFYQAYSPGAEVESLNLMITSITAVIALISAISLLVGGIGVMNIMYVSVTERKREIGIRRAIGATPNSILLQFLFEAVFVTLIGGLIGIILGFLLSQMVGLFLPFPPLLSVSSFVGASITSITVGIVFGIIPARKAAKLDPIKAIYN
ncbi:MAG: ABC transporter permease [Turicibacter sp.]